MTPFASTIKFVVITLLIAGSTAAHAGCGGFFAAIRSRVVEAVGSGRAPGASVPSWVTESKQIDSAWWIEQIRASGGTGLRTLSFTDGSTAALGPYLDEGRNAYVFCLTNACDDVIKLPKITVLDHPALLTVEVARTRELSAAGFAVAEIAYANESGVPYLIKPYVRGRTLGQIQRQKFSVAQIDRLAATYAAGVRSRLHPDLLGQGAGNLIWDDRRADWILVDAGAEVAPAFFQPFGKTFRSNGEITSTLMLYLETVFRGDQVAALRFRDTAMRLGISE